MSYKPFDWREEDFTDVVGGAQKMDIDASLLDHTFRVAAPVGETWVVDTMVLLIQDATGWDSTGFGGIAGGLPTGMRVRFRDLITGGGTNIWSYVVKDNVELMERLPLRSITDFANSQTVATWALQFEGAIGVHVTDEHVLEMVIRDDMSPLTKMRAHVHYGILA